MKRIIAVFIVALLYLPIQAQISTFNLENGLTVIVNQDDSTPSIFGCFIVKAGSVDEPSDATGLAHYLEHMLFKGSTNVGTTDWESEKKHYDRIIELYDELAAAPPEQQDEIQKRINDETLLAGNYTLNNEFSNLIQAIGGTSLNAATGYDMTYYFNVFPSFMLKKWLTLQTDRFENPVFRGFQAELETVYEEKNMYSDNAFQVLFEEFNALLYGDNNPYARPIIGLTEHLKVPSLGKLIEFYNTFYVPSNMALVLSGNVNLEEAKVLAEQTVGKWAATEPIKRSSIDALSISQKKLVKKKLTPMPILMLGFSGTTANSKDSYVLDVLSSVLSNSHKTGLFDKLVLDGDVQQLVISASSQRQVGAISIIGIPTFDPSQRRYQPFSVVEKHVNKALKELMNGEVEDWLITSVKDEMILNYQLAKESNLSYGMMIAQAYGSDTPISDIENYTEIINAIAKEDVIAAAKKYFDAPYIAMQSQMGKPKKDKISKPDYKPIEPATGRSAFAQQWIAEEVVAPEFKPIDFKKDAKITEFAPRVTLFHTENSANDIFSLTIIYGVGSDEIPELSYSVSLMNMAGVLAQHTPYELKKEFSNLGCRVYFSNDSRNTYVTLIGKEENLAQACLLLSKTYLLPSLDDKQLNSLKGSEIGQRIYEKNDKDSQASALNEYLKYGRKSRYLNRIPNEEVISFTASSLAGAFIKATKYETSVHYTGRYPFKKVQEILTKSLAFPSNLKPSVSNKEIPMTSYDENTIFLFHNKDARQSDIYLFVPGEKFELSQQPIIHGFNEYFGGGFNGLVLQELRELRSLAYTASAGYSIPSEPNQQSRFYGYIGTQGDKTLDAVREFKNLVANMPKHPNRTDNIKSYLMQATLNATPSVRSRTMLIEDWMDYGYEKDPRIDWVDEYKNLEFQDIVDFYNNHIEGKPIGIGIVANKKDIDMKELKKLGKVKVVNTGKLFKY